MKRIIDNKIDISTAASLAALLALAVFFLPLSPAFSGEAAPEYMPLSVRRALHRAARLMEEGKPGEAAELIGKFKADPKTAEDLAKARHLVLFIEGNARYQAGDRAGARAAFEGAVKAAPGYQPAWQNLALACYEDCDPGRAAECFARAYDLDEDKKPELLYSSAAAFFSAERWAESAAGFDRLLADHPAQVGNQWLEYAAHARIRNGEPKAALPLMERLAQNSTGAERLRWNQTLMGQYMALDMPEKALALARRLASEEPGEPLWWKALANMELSRDRLREGLKALWAYGRLQPWNREETLLAADLYLSLDMPDQALALIRGLEPESLSPELVKKAVYCCRRLLKPGEALELLDSQAKRLGDQELVMLRADILYESGDYGRAGELYEQAARKGFSPGKAWLMAGYAALAAGDRARAGQAFREAGKYPGQRREAQSILGRLS